MVKVIYEELTDRNQVIEKILKHIRKTKRTSGYVTWNDEKIYYKWTKDENDILNTMKDIDQNPNVLIITHKPLELTLEDVELDILNYPGNVNPVKPEIL